MATRDKRVFSEKEEWKKANKKVIYCRAVELDEMSFKKNCADWAYFFRLSESGYIYINETSELNWSEI